MNTKTTTQVNFIELLEKFVNQRAGLNFADYGDRKIFMAERREITKDMHDFYDLLKLARWYVDNLNEKIEDYLIKTSDRLTYTNNRLQYITGQYFPTEYRPACCNVLRVIIWREFMNERKPDGSLVYETGHDIRKAIHKYVSRRVARNYFN